MVLDEPFLFSVSIRDNIAYGRPDAPIDEIRGPRPPRVPTSSSWSSPEGYDTVVGERGFTLSGGQRQRIAIARTLLVNPPILILDDATSAIDVQVEQQIHEALRKLMEGRTTLIIAHRLSTISLADRVVVLEGGRIVAEGTHAELLATEPRYAEILAQSGDRRAASAQPRPGLRSTAARPAAKPEHARHSTTRSAMRVAAGGGGKSAAAPACRGGAPAGRNGARPAGRASGGATDGLGRWRHLRPTGQGRGRELSGSGLP